MFNFFNKKIQNTKKGFTLVEMTIVAAIFGLLTAVVVFKYGDFTSNLLVTNMAYEIALTTRQAQIFGLGVRGYGDGVDKNFNYPYGVFFNMNDGSTGSPDETKRFSFFVDRNEDNEPGYGQCNTSAGNGDCSCATGDECMEQLTLQRNIKITELKVSANVNTCEADDVDKLAITFQRPSPEARIEWQTYNQTGYEFAQLKIEAQGSDIKPAYVLIRKNGQISVSGNDICSVTAGDEGDNGDNGDNGNNNQTTNIYGCTDSTANNYNPSANLSDGSCTYSQNNTDVYGCTNPTATNYNVSANVDDGTCSYGQSDIYGCTDPAANNYNSGANMDDGSCMYTQVETPVYGCTNPTAMNYNSSATVDDGGCMY